VDRGIRTSHDAVALVLLQVALAAAAGWALIARESRPAGLAVIAAALAGAAAVRMADRSGAPRAAFAAEAAERLQDAGTLVPLVWVAQGVDPRTALAALIVLGTGAVASYERARGRGLGYPLARWFVYRPVRTALLGLGLLVDAVEPALWAMAAMDVAVGAARWRIVARAAP
jgi:hypothetical protein